MDIFGACFSKGFNPSGTLTEGGDTENPNLTGGKKVRNPKTGEKLILLFPVLLFLMVAIFIMMSIE